MHRTIIVVWRYYARIAGIVLCRCALPELRDRVIKAQLDHDVVTAYLRKTVATIAGTSKFVIYELVAFERLEGGLYGSAT